MDNPEGPLPITSEAADEMARKAELEQLLQSMEDSPIMPKSQAEVDALAPTPLVRPKPTTSEERTTQFAEQAVLNQSYFSARSVISNMGLESKNQQNKAKIAGLEKAVDDANIDPLTGLSNRRLLFEEYEGMRLSHSKDNKRATPDNGAHILIVDIDDFRDVNSAFGHDGGDRALEELAKIVKGNIRRRDTAGRWGGDEFVIILPRIVPERAQQIAQNILEGARSSADFPTTLSIGVSKVENYDQDLTTIVSEADKALYAAKAGGKDIIVNVDQLGQQPLEPLSS